MPILNTLGVFISPPLKGRGWGGVCNLLAFKHIPPPKKLCIVQRPLTPSNLRGGVSYIVSTMVRT